MPKNVGYGKKSGGSKKSGGMKKTTNRPSKK